MAFLFKVMIEDYWCLEIFCLFYYFWYMKILFSSSDWWARYQQPMWTNSWQNRRRRALENLHFFLFFFTATVLHDRFLIFATKILHRCAFISRHIKLQITWKELWLVDSLLGVWLLIFSLPNRHCVKIYHICDIIERSQRTSSIPKGFVQKKLV